MGIRTCGSVAGAREQRRYVVRVEVKIPLVGANSRSPSEPVWLRASLRCSDSPPRGSPTMHDVGPVSATPALPAKPPAVWLPSLSHGRLIHRRLWTHSVRAHWMRDRSRSVPPVADA